MRYVPFLFVITFNIAYSVWLWMVLTMRFKRPEIMYASKDFLIWAFIVITGISALRATGSFERGSIEGALIYISFVYAISISNHLNLILVNPHAQLILINLLTMAFAFLLLKNGKKHKLFGDGNG